MSASTDDRDASMGDGMELRDIEVFLALADELHFGRTGDRLRLSQSRVSRVIQKVERQIGGPLFDRTSRSVRLTALGVQLRDELGPAHAGLVAAVARARERASRPTGRLRIGLWSLPSGGDFLLDIVRGFRARHPGRQVELVASGALCQLDALRAGRLDMLVLWLPVTEPDLVVGPVLSTQQRVVRMSVHHPLAVREVITVEDLAEHEVVSFHGVPKSSLHALAPARTPAGRPIRRRGAVRDQVELTNLIALGAVVHAAVASVPSHSMHPDITHRPLHGLPPARSALVWHESTRNPSVRAFAEIAEKLPETRRAGSPGSVGSGR
jgi:DNA-binding transcriptional LysR family regulator